MVGMPRAAIPYLGLQAHILGVLSRTPLFAELYIHINKKIILQCVHARLVKGVEKVLTNTGIEAVGIHYQSGILCGLSEK